jgi:muconolactone delta-isomerase
MKFLVIQKPGPTNPPQDRIADLVKRVEVYCEDLVKQGRAEQPYLFATGGGFSVVDADSAEELHEILLGNPMALFSDWEVHPVLDMHRGLEKVHAAVRP